MLRCSCCAPITLADDIIEVAEQIKHAQERHHHPKRRWVHVRD